MQELSLFLLLSAAHFSVIKTFICIVIELNKTATWRHPAAWFLIASRSCISTYLLTFLELPYLNPLIRGHAHLDKMTLSCSSTSAARSFYNIAGEAQHDRPLAANKNVAAQWYYSTQKAEEKKKRKTWSITQFSLMCQLTIQDRTWYVWMTGGASRCATNFFY